MKNFIRKDRILIALAILGLIASLIPVAARVRAEEANKYYDIVLDYPSIRAMALQSEYDEGEWLDMLREYGADKIALGEVGLTGEIRAVMNAEKIVLEADRLGYKTMILPADNARKLKRRPAGLRVIGVKNLFEAVTAFKNDVL